MSPSLTPAMTPCTMPISSSPWYHIIVKSGVMPQKAMSGATKASTAKVAACLLVKTPSPTLAP